MHAYLHANSSRLCDKHTQVHVYVYAYIHAYRNHVTMIMRIMLYHHCHYHYHYSMKPNKRPPRNKAAQDHTSLRMTNLKCQLCRAHRPRRMHTCCLCAVRVGPSCRPERCWVPCMRMCRQCFLHLIFIGAQEPALSIPSAQPSPALPESVEIQIMEYLENTDYTDHADRTRRQKHRSKR